MPSMELILEGVDPRIAALSLASRGADDDGAPPVLTGIAIYRRNILRLARNPEFFDQELRYAILEELAAFLQLDDDRRVALGLHPLGIDDLGDAEDEDEAERAVEEPKPSRRRRRKRMHS
jgi:hypothetical protein